MTDSRLDSLLVRQRNHLWLDLVLAALVVVGLGIAAMGFAAGAPALATSNGEPARVTDSRSPATYTAQLLAEQPYVVK